MIVNIDIKYYLDFIDVVYRFMLLVFIFEDIKWIYGFNEWLGVKNYEKIINYFYYLMWNVDVVIIEIEELYSELWGEEGWMMFVEFLDGINY